MKPTGRTRTSSERLAPPDLDSLGAIRARPALIEHAVRTALIDAMKWRLGGGAPPAEAAFAFAAAAAARQELARSRISPFQRADDASTARAARAAAAAATRFFRTPLGKRLMTLPFAQIRATCAQGNGGADVIIRDLGGRLHLIALTALRRPLEIGARARDVAAKTQIAPHDCLSPVRIHMYSLVTGNRHESSGWTTTRAAPEARTA